MNYNAMKLVLRVQVASQYHRSKNKRSQTLKNELVPINDDESLTWDNDVPVRTDRRPRKSRLPSLNLDNLRESNDSNDNTQSQKNGNRNLSFFLDHFGLQEQMSQRHLETEMRRH